MFIGKNFYLFYVPLSAASLDDIGAGSDQLKDTLLAICLDELISLPTGKKVGILACSCGGIMTERLFYISNICLIRYKMSFR